MSENRQAFERFISSPPFEKSIERFPTGDAKYPWPGAYRDITVELAWECWREATFAQGAQFEAQLAEADSRIKELEQRLAEAEAKIPRWIPVGERLPEHNQLIAILTEHEKLCGEFYLDRFVVRDFTGVCFDASCVTHWMPLPEPPESGKGE